jgi:hypothetical protein
LVDCSPPNLNKKPELLFDLSFELGKLKFTFNGVLVVLSFRLLVDGNLNLVSLSLITVETVVVVVVVAVGKLP